MEGTASSSEVSLEILVHASARDTNQQDAIYRQQGVALLDYVSRSRQYAYPEKQSVNPLRHMQQTPVAAEILVPKTKSNIKSKPIHNTGTSYAIIESIRVSAESNPDEQLKQTTEHASDNALISSFRSATSSTASILEGYTTPGPLRRGGTGLRSPQKSTSKKITGRESHSTTSDASLPVGSFVSPDSLKFKLQSPNGYLTRKRELQQPTERPRTILPHVVLAELSPNKRIKPNGLSNIADDEKSSSMQAVDSVGPRLHPDGWLSSIANLTSSSSIESMPKPLPSLDNTLVKSRNAFMAPWPSSGHEPYKSHLVGTLALVAGVERLCAAYRPKEVKRKIEPLERGYWHLRIPYSWSSADQESFWRMLEEMITEGKCGWGNWVEHITDALDTTVSDEASKVSQEDSLQKHVSEIKVWCWGEVVREIWLSLLMASRRQTLRLGMTWHDSCGNIVIRMK